MIRGLDYYFCDYGDPKRDHFIRDITVAYDYVTMKQQMKYTAILCSASAGIYLV